MPSLPHSKPRGCIRSFTSNGNKDLDRFVAQLLNMGVKIQLGILMQTPAVWKPRCRKRCRFRGGIPTRDGNSSKFKTNRKRSEPLSLQQYGSTVAVEP